MTEQIQSAPVCEKHGCEKIWIKDKRKKRGGYWGCNKCNAEKAARYRARHPERVKETERKSYAKHAPKRRQGCANYRKNNHEICRASHDKWLAKQPGGAEIERQRIWRENNRDLSRKSSSAWAKNNPEKVFVNLNNRKARKLNAIVPGRPVTAAIEKERKALFNGCCYCGAQKKLTLEHVVALDAGGLHVKENLLGACGACNSSKRDRPVEEWFRAQKFFTEERWQQIQQALEG